ncbi:MAG: hypothetical protein IJP29_01125 [Lachnospiraceae bacterium]|nr:hypothetical protein [Lachnospiraceae bacterium]
MTPIQKKRLLRRRMRMLEKRKRYIKSMERKRRVSVMGLRLHQRLQSDIQGKKMLRAKRSAERKQRLVAKRETAKLNRTLRRRRKK